MFKKTLTLITLIGLLSANVCNAVGRIQNEDVKSLTDLESSVLSTTGNLTLSSACISSPASTTGLVTGLYIYDTTNPTYISSGTTIAGLPGTCSAGQIQMSTTATHAATGDTITFGGQASQLINDTKIWATGVLPNQTLYSALNTGAVGGSGGSSVNMLTASDNYGFEQGSTNGWTKTSGDTFTVIASSQLFGSYSGQYTASASGHTLYSNLKSIPVGLQGQNCLASIAYEYPTGSSGDYSLIVSNGSTTVQSQTLPVTTSVQTANVSFVCPSSGSLEVGLVSNVSSPSAITFDGPGFNAGQVLLGSNALANQVSQAQLWGTVSISATSQSSITSTTSYQNFPAYSSGYSCTATGNASCPGTNIQAIAFSSLPPGEYAVEMDGAMYIAEANVATYWRFSDGTNVTREQSYVVPASNTNFSAMTLLKQSINYTTPQSNITIQPQAKTSSGSNPITLGSSMAGQPIVIRVYYFPAQSQLAVSSNTTPASWSGYTSGATWTTTSTTFNTGTVSGTPTVTARQNRNFGTVSQASSNVPGITFTPPASGRYMVCGSVAMYQTTSDHNAYFELYDATNSIQLNTAFWGAPNSSGGNTGATSTICGILNLSSTASETVEFQMASDSGSSTSGISTGGGSIVNPIEWQIFGLDQSFPAPNLVGSVTSQSTGAEHIERAYIANSGSCSITSQSGSWISSVSHPGTGRCTLNFSASEWSAAPSCVVSQDAGSAAVGREAVFSVTPTTSTTEVFTTNSAPAAADFPFMIICMGPH
jgi:hypothetical protein